eukprot:s5821_g2.t3
MMSMSEKPKAGAVKRFAGDGNDDGDERPFSRIGMPSCGAADSIFRFPGVSKRRLKLRHRAFTGGARVGFAQVPARDLATMRPASDAVLAASPTAAAGTLSELGLQDPANFAWACATPGFEEVVPLGGAVEAAMSRASESSPQNLANAARGFAALLLLGLALVDAVGTAGTMHLRPDLCETDVSISLTGIVWAFHFVDLLDEGFYSQVRSFLRARGRQLDTNNTGRNWHPAAATLAEGRSVSSVPKIVVDLPDRFVLFKPPGWEVDTTDAGKGKHLSEFVQDLGCPIFRDAEHGFGFLHRLDTPSSGLILTAKSFEAFYDLKLQLNTGAIVRDYVVLCHGCWDAT